MHAVAGDKTIVTYSLSLHWETKVPFPVIMFALDWIKTVVRCSRQNCVLFFISDRRGSIVGGDEGSQRPTPPVVHPKRATDRAALPPRRASFSKTELKKNIYIMLQ